jgi:hypothetical protein
MTAKNGTSAPEAKIEDDPTQLTYEDKLQSIQAHLKAERRSEYEQILHAQVLKEIGNSTEGIEQGLINTKKAIAFYEQKIAELKAEYGKE